MERSLFDLANLEAAESEFVRTHTHSEASRNEVTAAKVAHRRAANVRERVLSLVRAAGMRGITYPEAQIATGKRSAQQRLSDLLKQKLIAESGHSRPHPETGMPCAVYIAADLKYEPGAMG